MPDKHAESQPSEDFHRTVREAIRTNALMDQSYVVMNSLAAVVATCGLLANSTAVVIGAMIIAALLGPITGIALALVDGDTKLLWNSSIAEIVGASIVCFVAYVVGRMSVGLQVTSELLARTQPNFLDLVIAIAGGAAGAYANISPRMSVGLVGVAIATALVPPLCTASVFLAWGKPVLASGALLLFIANLVAIQFSTSAVLWAYGFHQSTLVLGTSQRVRIFRGASIGVLILLGIYLAFTLSKQVKSQQIASEIRTSVAFALGKLPGTSLIDLTVRPSGTEHRATVVIRTPYSFDADKVMMIEEAILMRTGMVVNLSVRSVLIKEATRDGYMHTTDQPSGDELGQGSGVGAMDGQPTP